jgi:hypothetical protein
MIVILRDAVLKWSVEVNMETIPHVDEIINVMRELKGFETARVRVIGKPEHFAWNKKRGDVGALRQFEQSTVLQVALMKDWEQVDE